MNRSESVADIAAALSKFQGETNNAFKAKQGHGYNYADLAAILEQSRPLLASNGLSVVQMPFDAPSGFIGIETCILHVSGQFIEQGYSMPVPDNKRNSMAQNFGSAITYARRYALAAALGIAQTDEDASEKIDIVSWLASFNLLSDNQKKAEWNGLSIDQQNAYNQQAQQ
jgi:hypothetical protein